MVDSKIEAITIPKGSVAITIPEGSVKKITANGIVRWERPTPYKNLAEPLPDNTTDTSKWVNGYRLTTSTSNGVSAQNGTTISNEIPITFGDVIRVKGVTLREGGADRYLARLTLVNGNELLSIHYFNANALVGAINYITYEGLEDGVYTWKVTSETYGHIPIGFRFSMPTPANANDVIITLNEPIV